jgi:putative membrane-bound dehydrogenase-like protein
LHFLSAFYIKFLSEPMKKILLPRFAWVFPAGLILLLGLLSAFAPARYSPLFFFRHLLDNEQRETKNALAGLKVADDLQAGLFAAEPMMLNPTNLDIDARGRVWICEGYNYRNELNPGNPYHKKGDCIRILEDTDGDGKADKSKVFYQGEDVNAALGIAVLGNKVIVSCSPNVFLFTDENGDDVADKKEILFTGLGGVQHDHAVHAFSFGPDGKLYFNFGNAGEQILDKNKKPLTDDLGRTINGTGKPYRQGMVFRCNPDGSNVEILGHNFRNNYEVAVDAFGTMWQSDNDDDGNKGVRINYVMEYGNYGYTDEMTGAGWQARRTNMEPEIPRRHWHLNDPGTIPNLLQTGAGSPTGMVVYEGNLLPERFRNQMIHCDAGPNIVRAYPVQRDGAGYKATIENLIDGSEGDKWFRPSDVGVAPDGSLFVSDWYDPGVGGHQMGDTLRGRVYRISPKGVDAYKNPTFNFETATGCIAALQNPNLSVRYLAWTKLNAMQGKAEKELLKLWKSDNPRMRARALWLLGNIKGKEEKYVNQAVQDKDPDIRITGIRLARQLKSDPMPVLRQVIRDPSAQVRREAAIALRHNTSPEAARLWATLANQHDGKDRWYLEALGVAADNQWDRFYEAWRKQVENQNFTVAQKDIIWRSRSKKSLSDLGELVLASNRTDQLRYFRAFDFQADAAKTDVLLGILEKNKQSDVAMLVFRHLEPESAKQSPQFREALPGVLAKLKGTPDYLDFVQRYGLKEEIRQVTALAISIPDSSLGEEAARLVYDLKGIDLIKTAFNDPDKNKALAAISVFGKVEKPEIKQMLQAIYENPKSDLDVRKTAIQRYGWGWDSETKLLELVKAGKYPKELESTLAAFYATVWRGSLRTEASKYLKVSTIDGKTLPPVAELVKLTGNPEQGRQIAATYCYTCHQMQGKGAAFGPGLSEIGDKYGKEGLYTAILYPDAGISFGYEGNIFKLRDGSESQGIIASKTENEILLKLPGGSVQKLNRKDVISQEAMHSSLMPVFPLAQNDMVDLVEYLNGLKKVGK